MQKTTKFIVLGALLGLAVCENGSIKQKLGQVQSKNLAQQSIDLPGLTFDDLDCDCDLSDIVLPPAGGAAQTQVFSSSALVS